MNLKNNILKTIILLLLAGSLAYARFNPVESVQLSVANNYAADSIPYYSMVRLLLEDLSNNEEVKSEDFMRAFNAKDFYATDKMLGIIGSQIQYDIEDKGLFCFLLGAYYKVKPDPDKEFKEEVPNELFYLGSLYCNDAAPYCDNLFKKINLPKINAILKKKPRNYRIQKLESDYKQLGSMSQIQTSAYEACYIFPSLSLCSYTNNDAINANNDHSLLEKEVADNQKAISNSESKNNTITNARNKHKPSNPPKYHTAEEKYDFLKDYDPQDKVENKQDDGREITQKDLLNDQKKRYEQLHEIIVAYFKTNAHERNIRADCYSIKSYRSNSSDIGLTVRLSAYEDDDYCEMTSKKAEAFTDCLIGALKRHENITGTKFEDVSTSITIYCPKNKINGMTIAEKFTDMGVPFRNITQKNGDFGIEFNSPEYYNEELDNLNKKIQDYKKYNQKN